MAYTAYERTAGSSALNEVAALCKHLTVSGSFTTGTQPTLSEVEEWLTDAYRIINVKLMEYGYDQDQTDSDVKAALQHYNALWAAALVEFAQPSAGFESSNESRGDIFMRRFNEELPKLINSAGFSRLGATKAEDLQEQLSAGGKSVADKRTIDNDADFAKLKFRLGQFDDKGAVGTYQETRKDL